MDVKARVACLDACLKVSPYNEAAWLEFARLVKAGELEAAQKQVVRTHLSSMYRTFASYSDFVAKLLDDLVAVAAGAQERADLHEQAVALYERSNRADLACDARLKIAEHWARQKQWQKAAQGLTTTVKKFPTEGRYVPQMTAKLQEVSKNTKGGPAKLAQLYLELVPAMMIYYRGGEDEYAQKMYKQALAYLQDNAMDKQATQLTAKVEQARVLGSLRGRSRNRALRCHRCGPPSGLISAALDVIGRQDDPRWCPGVHDLRNMRGLCGVFLNGKTGTRWAPALPESIGRGRGFSCWPHRAAGLRPRCRRATLT
jgi:hypothetical protein